MLRTPARYVTLLFSPDPVSYTHLLGSQEAFDARYPQAKGGAPLTLAVGDGNHSLASAKACWEELKKTLTPEQAAVHPARWCLAEVCNVHSPAIEIEPIHRVLFNVDCATVLLSLITWSDSNMAVSYTHLDVYKRQHHRRGAVGRAAHQRRHDRHRRPDHGLSLIHIYGRKLCVLLVKSEAEWYNVAKAALCHFSLPDAFPAFPERCV